MGRASRLSIEGDWPKRSVERDQTEGGRLDFGRSQPPTDFTPITSDGRVEDKGHASFPRSSQSSPILNPTPPPLGVQPFEDRRKCSAAFIEPEN